MNEVVELNRNEISAVSGSSFIAVCGVSLVTGFAAVGVKYLIENYAVPIIFGVVPVVVPAVQVVGVSGPESLVQVVAAATGLGPLAEGLIYAGTSFAIMAIVDYLEESGE